MSNVTLVLTRTPFQPFFDGPRGGRFGRLIMVVGPLVQKASFDRIVDPNQDAVTHVKVNLAGKSQKLYLGLDDEGEDEDVEDIKEYDSMERFQDRGMAGYYMQVKPQSKRGIDYYPLSMFNSSTVDSIYTRDGVAHDGPKCLLVEKHGYYAQGTHNTAGILIHQADQVGYLIGCIAPGKKKGNGMLPDSSRKAMSEIFAAMGGFKKGTPARLIVLDW